MEVQDVLVLVEVVVEEQDHLFFERKLAAASGLLTCM